MPKMLVEIQILKFTVIWVFEQSKANYEFVVLVMQM